MFKLFTLLLASLAISSVLATPAPTDAQSEHCKICPTGIPVCNILCVLGEHCIQVPRTCQQCQHVTCVKDD
ncbi:hypothetical protein FB451DRAFT_1567662 [Mycena latifolia]|nr:hypothetical protein FB451DRAFT_1567662 [Mycena latifolia]